jgi:protein-arginine kinase activator protein McsA
MGGEMKKNIEHEYTREIVCPYCGYESSDSWDFSENEGLLECGECYKNFYFRRIVTVEYSTEKSKCANGESPHMWKSRAIEVDGKMFLVGSYHCRSCDTYKIFAGETRDSFETVEKI